MIVDDFKDMKPHLLQDLEEEKGTQNHSSQQEKQEYHQQYFETFSPFSDSTDLITIINPSDEDLSKSQSHPTKQEMPYSYNNNNNVTTRTVAVDTHDAPEIRSSQESFSSIATAIPKSTNRRRRSSSFTSSSLSSSACSYESCFSLVGQIPSKISKTEMDGPAPATLATQHKKANFMRSLSSEKVQHNTFIYYQ